MNYTIPRYLEMLKKNSNLFDPKHFEIRRSDALGISIRAVKPILQFEGASVKLGYNVGTRGNGVDSPRWPAEPYTEVVR
jgi:hypothetical protein